jgi:hypothetical protein
MQEGTEGTTGIETAGRVGAVAERGSQSAAVETETAGIGIADGTMTAVIAIVETMIEAIEAGAASAASETIGAAAAAGKAATGGRLAAAADATQLRRCGKQPKMLTVVGARRRRVQAAMRRAVRHCGTLETLEQWQRAARGSQLMQVSIKFCWVIAGSQQLLFDVTSSCMLHLQSFSPFPLCCLPHMSIRCVLLSCLQAAEVPTEHRAAARRRACRPAAAAAVQAHEAVVGAAVQQAQGTCQPWHGLGAQHQLPGALALLRALAASQVR